MFSATFAGALDQRYGTREAHQILLMVQKSGEKTTPDMYEKKHSKWWGNFSYHIDWWRFFSINSSLGDMTSTKFEMLMKNSS